METYNGRVSFGNSLMQKKEKRLEVVVLAAGQGTRMRSKRPKVLLEIGGTALVEHVIKTAFKLKPDNVHVVVGHESNAVQESLSEYDVRYAAQAEQLGTAHAVMQAMPSIDKDATVLILLGDVPLVSLGTLENCLLQAEEGISLVTSNVEDPSGLGRIIRGSDGRISRIVEEKDASSEECRIREINSGIFCVGPTILEEFFQNISTNNVQNEYYLTDIVAFALEKDIEVTTVSPKRVSEIQGVNDRVQLADLERIHQLDQARELMEGGVTLADPARIDVRGNLRYGIDCSIDINVVFEGEVLLGDGVMIGPGSDLRDVQLGDGVVVEPNTIIDGAIVGARCQLGPFARIRPGTLIGANARIGNFVETKKTKIGSGTKASHLAYLGDSKIGSEVNIGAGTITCNFDGVDKHKTIIGDDVFIGTNSTLVAPLTISNGAYVGAGSTITSDVDSDVLAVGRGRQRNITGWVSPAKKQSRSDNK